jgi:hypothetical protein
MKLEFDHAEKRCLWMPPDEKQRSLGFFSIYFNHLSYTQYFDLFLIKYKIS